MIYFYVVYIFFIFTCKICEYFAKKSRIFCILYRMTDILYMNILYNDAHDHDKSNHIFINSSNISVIKKNFIYLFVCS